MANLGKIGSDDQFLVIFNDFYEILYFSSSEGPFCSFWRSYSCMRGSYSCMRGSYSSYEGFIASVLQTIFPTQEYGESNTFPLCILYSTFLTVTKFDTFRRNFTQIRVESGPERPRNSMYRPYTHTSSHENPEFSC